MDWKHRWPASARRFVQYLALTISVCIVMTACTPPQKDLEVQRTDQQFSEVAYSRPDSQAILAEITRAEELAANSFLPFRVLKSLEEINSMTRDYYSMYTIAMIRNYIDVTDPFYSEEIKTLSDESAEIQARYGELFDAIMDSRFAASFSMLFGDSSIQDQQMQSAASSSSILDLNQKENELVSQYYYEFAQATVEVNGQEVLYSGLSAEEQDEYLYDFYQKYNPVFGKIFIDLVQVRDQMAKSLGYDDYSEIADQQLLRVAYDREDIRQFREALKESLAPAYQSYQTAFYERINRYYRNDGKGGDDGNGNLFLLGVPNPVPPGDYTDTFASLRYIYNRMSSETAECFNYMYYHGFMDIDPSPNKANMSFTTSIYNLNAPFLFTNFNGTGNDVQTFAHEFGHSVAFYLQQELGSDSEGRSLDICEIHSQAMQLLTMPYLDIIFKDEAEAARKYTVYTIVAGILSAAADDEFQEVIYQNPDMTLDEINALYRQLLLDYGLMAESPYSLLDLECLQWFQVNQYFDTPFYSIDYAVSGCVALEFLPLMDEEYGQALDTYFELVQQSPDDDFLTVVEKSGLSNPFDEAQLARLTGVVIDKIGEPYTGQQEEPALPPAVAAAVEAA